MRRVTWRPANTYSSSMGPILGILFSLIVLSFGMFVAWNMMSQLSRKRHELWKQVANEHGLDCLPGRLWSSPTLTGNVGAISVRVATEYSEAAQGNLIHFWIGYPAADAGSFELTKEKSFDIKKMLVGATDVEIGDETFDARVKIKAVNATSIASYLNPARRETVLALMDNSTLVRPLITNSSIRADTTAAADDGEALSRNVAMLIAAARVLGHRPQDQALSEPPALGVSKPSPLDDAVDAAPAEAEPVLMSEPVTPQDAPLPAESVEASSEPSAISFDQESLMHDLFDSGRMGHETDEHFARNYKNAHVEFTGAVDTIRTLGADNDFAGPGLKVTLMLGYLGGVELGSRKVNAVVQVPEGTEAERGQTLTVSGTLIRADRFTNSLYVANAALH